MNDFYNNNYSYNFNYEIGYRYLGLFMYGFCNYINKVVVENKINTILFASRDMYIVFKIYEKYFKMNGIDAYYVKSSRMALLRSDFLLSINRYVQLIRDDFFIHRSITINDYFKKINLPIMCSFCEQNGLNLDSLAYEHTEEICNLIIKNKDNIANYLKDDYKAANEYFAHFLSKNGPNYLFVDSHGTCSSSNMISHIFNRISKNEIVVKTLLMFTLADSNYLENVISSGKCITYMFNKSCINKKFDLNPTIFEFLFSEPCGSLQSYLQFKENISNDNQLSHKDYEQIVSACTDFLSMFNNMNKCYLNDVSPYDCSSILESCLKFIDNENDDVEVTLGIST